MSELVDNKVYFYGENLTYVNFFDHCLIVSQKESQGEVSNINNGDEHGILVPAGRDNTKWTANQLTSIMGKTFQSFGIWSSNNKPPSKLYFFVKGSLSFTIDEVVYTTNEIIFALGHNQHDRHDWWIIDPKDKSIVDHNTMYIKFSSSNGGNQWIRFRSHSSEEVNSYDIKLTSAD